MTTGRSSHRALWITLTSMAASAFVATGQGPTRSQSVQVPGIERPLEAGWRLLWTADHLCRYAIPATWHVSSDGRYAEPPDGAIFVSVVAIDVPSWSWHRRAVTGAMPAGAVKEDTSQRLWVELVDGSFGWQHVSVRDGWHVCSADVETRPRGHAADVAQKIAESVHVAHENDQRWMKP